MPPVPTAAALLAHGLGDAADLPLPFGIVLWLVGAAVLGTAALTSARGPADRRAGRHGAGASPGAAVPGGAGSPAAPPRAPQGLPLPRGLTALVTHPVTVVTLRAALLALVVVAVLLAALGPASAAVNPIPRLVYVLFWAGLVPLSLLLGPVWRAVNPLRLAAAGVSWLAGDRREHAVRPLPPGAGVWPAAALLGVFTWGELALPEEPRLTAAVVMVVVLGVLAGVTRHGRAWLDAGDPFEVYAGTLGALAPLGREPGGRLVLRTPRRHLARLAAPPGLVAVVAVLVGADLFDSVVATLTWQNLKVGLGLPGRVLLDSAGLAAAIVLVAVLAVAATRSAPALRPALLPVVAAYAVAHYVPVLLVEAQVGLGQLSDPLGRGWDLLGMAGSAATYDAIPGPVLAVGLLLVLVAGHLAAVVVAADRARLAYGARRAAAAQLPLRALLVVSALGSVTVRLSGG